MLGENTNKVESTCCHSSRDDSSFCICMRNGRYSVKSAVGEEHKKIYGEAEPETRLSSKLKPEPKIGVYICKALYGAFDVIMKCM